MRIRDIYQVKFKFADFFLWMFENINLAKTYAMHSGKSMDKTPKSDDWILIFFISNMIVYTKPDKKILFLTSYC